MAILITYLNQFLWSFWLSGWSLVDFVASKQVISPHSVVNLGKDQQNQIEISLARIGKLSLELKGSIVFWDITYKVVDLENVLPERILVLVTPIVPSCWLCIFLDTPSLNCDSL